MQPLKHAKRGHLHSCQAASQGCGRSPPGERKAEQRERQPDRCHKFRNGFSATGIADGSRPFGGPDPCQPLPPSRRRQSHTNESGAGASMMASGHTRCADDAPLHRTDPGARKGESLICSCGAFSPRFLRLPRQAHHLAFRRRARFEARSIVAPPGARPSVLPDRPLTKIRSPVTHVMSMVRLVQHSTPHGSGSPP